MSKGFARDDSRDTVVLGIDGGNSKVDVALARTDGTLLGARRGPTVSHQQRELRHGMEQLGRLVSDLAAQAGLPADGPVVGRCVATLAGADYPADIRLLRRAISSAGLSEHVTVLNDTVGALRAGASRPWGVGLVCGQGINASAIAPDGRRAGFPAVGDIAGDWGGGSSLGMAALAAAVRARDGRGPRTSLERSVPAFYGLRRPSDVTRALYGGRFGPATPSVGRLAPLVFEEAAAGDAVARGIAERLATELATMANALIRRLRMTRLDVEVVMAGGVFRTDAPGFYASIEQQVRAAAPGATFVRLRWPPVAGAVLLAIEETTGVSAELEVSDRIRSALARWDREVRES